MNKLKKALNILSYVIIIIFILIESFLVVRKQIRGDTFYSIKIGEYLTREWHIFFKNRCVFMARKFELL